MLKTTKEVAAKAKAVLPGRWAVGEGACLQVAKIAKRSTACWVFLYERDGRAKEPAFRRPPLIRPEAPRIGHLPHKPVKWRD